LADLTEAPVGADGADPLSLDPLLDGALPFFESMAV